eukprot:4044402-Lingulodinium_polyedra.AAC.1
MLYRVWSAGRAKDMAAWLARWGGGSSPGSSRWSWRRLKRRATLELALRSTGGRPSTASRWP